MGIGAGPCDSWHARFAQEWQTSERLRLLSEFYWRSADEPSALARMGWNVGFKHWKNVSWHGAVGDSLRASNCGGPDFRVYLGLKLEFTAPWRTAISQLR